MAVIVGESDSNAAGETVPAWIEQSNLALLIFYTIEVTKANPGILNVFAFVLTQTGWDWGRLQMCQDRRDIAGRALKARFGRIFVAKVDFPFKFGSPSATHPFSGPLILEDGFTNAPTRF